MRRVKLIHWKTEEMEERVERLKAAGYETDATMAQGPAFLRELGENQPDAVVIDLTRLPSHGRDMALAIRARKGTRYIPLVFVGGTAEKVARIKELLPDAVYTSWEEVSGALEQAVANPPEDPIIPKSTFDAYKGVHLVKKLGIKENFVVALVNAPEGIGNTLGDLPKGAQVHHGIGDQHHLAIWFTRSSEELEGDIGELVAMSKHGPIWIAWPKKASRMASDLTQQRVRDAGLASGLVDYKICSIDDTWSGLLFRFREVKEEG